MKFFVSPEYLKLTLFINTLLFKLKEIPYKNSVHELARILRLVRVADRELCGPGIIPIPLGHCELSIEYQHVLLAVHDFFDIGTSEGRTLGLWLLVQQILHLKEIISSVFLDVVLGCFLT